MPQVVPTLREIKAFDIAPEALDDWENILSYGNLESKGLSKAYNLVGRDERNSVPSNELPRRP